MSYRKPKHWSLSALNQYERCPSQYEWVRIMKNKDDLSSNPVIIRGIEIHKVAEGVLKKEITGFPSSLVKFKKEFNAIMKLETTSESDLAVDDQWKPCEWNDWDKVWCMAKADAIVEQPDHVGIIDFKTGKHRSGYEDQLELYASLCVERYPDIEVFNTELWFIDYGIIVRKEFKSKQLKKRRPHWEKRSSSMLNATEYPATPSDSACKWCGRRSDKGGDCDEWRTV